ncbi:MAG TPA: cation diffusion facilitator family transporter [Candidatus Bathyarchaeia archaeon]|nr:cation diffusion facilitator family transporter [Candidatus Bathyarchaeia archaeon]
MSQEDPHHHEERSLRLALGLTAAYCVCEIAGGYLTNSLALLSDAAHMFTDVAALGLSLFAASMARRPATDRKSYGYHRAEILAALANGVALWLVVAVIAVSAYERLILPVAVHAEGMLGVALVGLVVNVYVALILSGAMERSLNVRGAFLHVVSDLLGSIGAAAAGLGMMLTGLTNIDAIAAIAIGCLILFSSWGLVREAVDVLMESVPGHIDLDRLRVDLGSVPGALAVHDLHVWSITTGQHALSAHAVIAEDAVSDEVLAAMTSVLAQRHGITHVTIQIERASRAECEALH